MTTSPVQKHGLGIAPTQPNNSCGLFFSGRFPFSIDSGVCCSSLSLLAGSQSSIGRHRRHLGTQANIHHNDGHSNESRQQRKEDESKAPKEKNDRKINSLLALIFALVSGQIVRGLCLIYSLDVKVRILLIFMGFAIGFSIGRTNVGKKIESFVYKTRIFQRMLFNLLVWENACVKRLAFPMWEKPLHVFLVTFPIAGLGEAALLSYASTHHPLSLAFTLPLLLLYATFLLMYRCRNWIRNNYQATSEEPGEITWGGILLPLNVNPDRSEVSSPGHSFSDLKMSRPTTLGGKAKVIGAAMAGFVTPGLLIQYYFITS